VTDPGAPSGSAEPDQPVSWRSAATDATATLPSTGPGGSPGPSGNGDETTSSSTAEGQAPAGPVPEAQAPEGQGPGDDGGDGTAAKPEKPRKGTARVFLEWVVLIAVALAIAFVIKSFLFQAFYIPSESMTPTLQVGDRVLVNKLSYDLHDVNRGDIIVFEAPPLARSADIEDLVKRVVGLPGDTVTGDAKGGILVNGRELDEPYLPKDVQTTFTDVAPGCGAPPGGEPGCVVPKGHLFMMGDNREASKDSRVFGPINEDSIVGRVFVRIWPLSDIGLL
jgi:signal peptidase I